VLRAENDDYGARGWCAMELAVARPEWRHFLVRTDLLETPILEAELLATGVGDETQFLDFRRMLFTTMHKWTSAEDGRAILRGLQTQAFMSLDEVEDARPVPLFITPRAPNIFPGQKALLVFMIDALAGLDQVDRLISDGRLNNADVGQLVEGAMAAAGLTCTDHRDIVYVGLALLYARHVGAFSRELAAFYAKCIARHQRGQTLALKKLRLHMEMSSNRLWAVFEDEPIGWPYLDMPEWARTLNEDALIKRLKAAVGV